LAINSTFYAIALQRPQGTVLEYHSITINFPYRATAIGPAISLFPTPSGNAAPFPATGSSVIQNLNDTRLLLAWSSIRAIGSPATAAILRAGAAITPINQDGAAFPSVCSTIAIPQSLILDPSGSRGVMSYSAGSTLFYFAEFRPQNSSMTSFLSSGVSPLILRSEFTPIKPGTLPAFVSPTSESILASISTSYFGYTFSSSLITTPTTSPSIDLRSSNAAFAAGRSGSRTLALTCAGAAYCAVDISSTNTTIRYSPPTSFGTG
jgi:hypothetical protein